jgi:hypothetical protein
VEIRNVQVPQRSMFYVITRQNISVHKLTILQDAYAAKTAKVGYCYCSGLYEVRCRDVVLEGRSTDLGKPWGGGKLEWGGGGQFTSNLGPGWTRIAPSKEEGFQVSRKDPGERGVVKGN